MNGDEMGGWRKGRNDSKQPLGRFDPAGFAANAARCQMLQESHLVEPKGSSTPPSLTKPKKALTGPFFDFGGEGGIRTLDTLPYTHFPGVRLRPLGHLSVARDSSTSKRRMAS